jgi:hypothetical protein
MIMEAQKMKTGPEALGTAENESGCAIHENETQRPWILRKWEAQNMKTGLGVLGTAENGSGRTKHENWT